MVFYILYFVCLSLCFVVCAMLSSNLSWVPMVNACHHCVVLALVLRRKKESVSSSSRLVSRGIGRMDGANAK